MNEKTIIKLVAEELGLSQEEVKRVLKKAGEVRDEALKDVDEKVPVKLLDVAYSYKNMPESSGEIEQEDGTKIPWSKPAYKKLVIKPIGSYKNLLN
jgi:hypothetical protein